MKSIFFSGSLYAALRKLKPYIGINSVLPILEDVLIQVKDGKMKLTVTNLEQSKSVYVSAECPMDYELCAPFQMLHDFLKQCPGESVFESCHVAGYVRKFRDPRDKRRYINDPVPSQWHLKYQIGNASGLIKVATEDAQDFPRVVVMDSPDVSFVITEEMSKSFNEAVKFAFKDSWYRKGGEKYVCLQFQSGNVSIIGYSEGMYCATYPVDYAKTKRVFIPTSCLKELKIDDVLSVKFDADKSLFSIEREGECLTSKVENSVYGFPKKEKLDSTFNMNGGELLEIYADKGTQKVINSLLKLDKKDHTIKMSLNGHVQFSKEKTMLDIYGEWTGKEKDMEINGELFAEMLSYLASPALRTFEVIEQIPAITYRSENEIIALRYK